MRTIHEAKIEPRFLDMILSGEKTVEIRCGFDWGYVCNHTDRHYLTLSDDDRTVTYLVSGQHAFPKGDYPRNVLIERHYEAAGFDSPENLAAYLIKVYGTQVFDEYTPFVLMRLQEREK